MKGIMIMHFLNTYIMKASTSTFIVPFENIILTVFLEKAPAHTILSTPNPTTQSVTITG